MPRLGGVIFIIRRVLNRRSPSEAHYLLVGFAVFVAAVADYILCMDVSHHTKHYLRAIL